MAYREINKFSNDLQAETATEDIKIIDIDYNDINKIKSILEKLKNDITKKGSKLTIRFDSDRNQEVYSTLTRYPLSIEIYYITKQPLKVKPGTKMVKNVPFFYMSALVCDKYLQSFKKIFDSQNSKLGEIQYFEEDYYFGLEGSELEGQCISVSSKDDLTILSNFLSRLMKIDSEKGFCHIIDDDTDEVYDDDDFFLFLPYEENRKINEIIRTPTSELGFSNETLILIIIALAIIMWSLMALFGVY